MLTLIHASENNFEKIAAFYRYVIDNTPTMPQYCRWIYGLHPSDELLHRYIGEGAMFYTERDGEMLSVLVIVPHQDEDYHEVQWGADLSDDEVVTLHIFGVDPAHRGQGLARQTMAAVEEYARRIGKKAVRLDTLESNLASQSLYTSIGYVRRDVKRWYARNTGWDNFILYEKLL